jgi:hypothetical protein
MKEQGRDGAEHEDVSRLNGDIPSGVALVTAGTTLLKDGPRVEVLK